MTPTPNPQPPDEWETYLKESGNFETYIGTCSCCACQSIQDGFIKWQLSRANPQPPLVISEEAREAGSKSVRQLGMYDPKFHPVETRNVIELVAGFTQLAINQATERLTKENEKLRNLCLIRDMDRAQAQLLLDVTSRIKELEAMLKVYGK